MEERPLIVNVVGQEEPQVVGEHEHGDHLEELEHEVEDNEVVVVSALVCEGSALAGCQGASKVQVLLGQPFQNHHVAEMQALKSSEAKSSEAKSSWKVAKRAGETRVSIPCQ